MDPSRRDTGKRELVIPRSAQEKTPETFKCDSFLTPLEAVTKRSNDSHKK
jgi:hypothetical protein